MTGRCSIQMWGRALAHRALALALRALAFISFLFHFPAVWRCPSITVDSDAGKMCRRTRKIAFQNDGP